MAPMIGGDHTFEGESDFSGMIKGDATVAAGATLRLQGMVQGDMIVSEGARLDLLGMVKGDLIMEQGAHATVSGDIVNHGGTVALN